MVISKSRDDYRFHHIWSDLKQRCNNPKCKRFKDYGDRGIKYCLEWNLYKNFKNDMWESYKKHCLLYGEKQTTLDRIDVNKGYFKENCRWATYQEQSVNTRNKKQYVAIDVDTNKKYVFNNCLQFCKDNNLNRNIVQSCIKGIRTSYNGYIFRRVSEEEKINLLEVHIYIPQKIKKDIEQEKIKIYEKYYKIYNSFGWQYFLEKTKYPYTKQNLVEMFKKYVKDFVPQNGKKRGKVIQ